MSLHLTGGLLGANSTAADVAKLFGALQTYIADQQAGPDSASFGGIIMVSNENMCQRKHLPIFHP